MTTTTTGTNAVSDYSNTEKASDWTTTSTTTPIFLTLKTTSVSPDPGSATKKTTCKKDNSDYGMDYGQYDYWATNTSTASGFEVGLTYALLGLGLIGAILVLLSSVIFPSRAKGYRGIRWYCVNLMLCGIVHILIFAYNSPVLNPTLDKAIGSIFNVKKSYKFGPYAFIKKYNVDMNEWYNCVYLLTTAIASVECTWRYLSKKSGFPHLMWYNIVLIADFLPLIYIVLKKEIYTAAVIAPDPLASYHMIIMIFSGSSGATFLLLVIFLIIRHFLKKGGARANQPTSFELNALVCMCLYGIFTILFQYTCVVTVVQNILKSYGTQGNAVAMQLGQSMPDIVSLQLAMDDWSLSAMVFVQSFLILLFMPSYPCQKLLTVEVPGRIGHLRQLQIQGEVKESTWFLEYLDVDRELYTSENQSLAQIVGT
uniref:Uncharacterized protein n=1 Tax=Acrobeloides nanus TaxID=290746 RepID=A0A914CW29_9BILA